MKNPFEILGLPPRFQLTDEEIERRYFELSREYHPDASAGAARDPSEQVALLQKSADINDAHRTLRNPWSRVEALILLRDGKAMEATKTLCPMFLMEAMEVREDIQDAAGSELAGLQGEVRRKVDQYFADVVARLEEGEVRAAATLLHQSNYYRKALDELRRRMESDS